MIKYYMCRQYNEEGKYCSHRIISIDVDKYNLMDYLHVNETYDEITREEWDTEQSFYKVTVNH